MIADAKFRDMSFGYDANGRMVKAAGPNVPDALSIYDASGLRVAEKVNDVWRFTIYDIGGKCVAEYGGMAASDEGGVKYVLQDWQGSTRAIVGGTGYVTSRSDYTAFGENIGMGTGLRTSQQGFGVSDSLRQRYGLTERDDATGLDHTWFRKNENQAGRWTSPDPYNGSMSLGNPQSWNRYSYVESQPTNFIDPSGLNEEEPIIRIETRVPGDPFYYMRWLWYLYFWSPTGTGATTVENGASGAVDSPRNEPRDPCEDILEKVLKALILAARRAHELQQDALNLVGRGIFTSRDLENYIRNMNDGRSPASIRDQGSVESHETSYRQANRNLRRRINNFKNNDCGDKGFKLPEEAEKFARLIEPPKRIRPLPDNSLFSPETGAKIVVAGWVVYWIVSEVSRFAFPLRNLVPVP